MILRIAYLLGRAVGAGLSEIINGLWPNTTPTIPVNAIARKAVDDPRPEDVVETDMDWMGWAVPAISEVLTEHEYVDMTGFQPNANKGTCYCLKGLYEHEMDSIEWIDHVAFIIAERTACDPARAIAALWNYQLKQGTP